MTPLLLTCTCLLLPCCVPVTRSSNELQFYRDGVAEVAKLARYLESQEHRDRTVPFSDLSSFLIRQPHKKYHLEREQESERDLFRRLSDESKLADMLRKGNVDDWNHRREMDYDLPMETGREREGHDYEQSHYGANLLARMKGYTKEYPSSKLSYFPPTSPHNQHKENADSFQNSINGQPPYYSHFHHLQDTQSNSGNSAKFHVVRPVISEFTFRFDDSNLGERHPFAVKPNDPRYYRDSAFFSDPREDNDEPSQARVINGDGSNSWKSPKWDLFSTDTENVANDQGESQPFEEDMVEKTMNNQFKDISMLAINDLNNDIYFIAIVAGCSAAAMFALVLISLTWYRLQRGVKAAADIEYPAYGVTGPNKDVSPSGDQRLAHSAQMYHFQHQKQQIIAMENRASAGRDPGSVSEAESDEENDEGHHTVYECPGLASTGELEVKNPMFQDDSMPVTPSHSAKEEDHM